MLIPCYNSSDTLSILLDKITMDSDFDVIVVDDGSNPQCESDIDSVTILRNSKNTGKGYSLLKGFRYAQEKGFSHAVTLDADLQHNPSEIHKFMKVDMDVDFVLGYRKKDRSMPVHRKLSNTITTYLLSKLSSRDILDSQCGFRRYNLAAVDSCSYREDGFQFESEVLIKCLKSNFSLEQINIETIYDKNNKSYINHVSDTLKFIRLILRSLLRR